MRAAWAMGVLIVLRMCGVRKLVPVVVLLLVPVGLLGFQPLRGQAQEPEYLVVPANRLGRWELGKNLDAYSFGRASHQWEGKNSKGMAYYDGYLFPFPPFRHALESHVCKSDQAVFALIVRALATGTTDQEARQFRTKEGVGIGMEEAEVLRLLGRPHSVSEWTEREGSVASYNYPGLLVRIGRVDRRVVGVGVSIEDGNRACEQSVLARIMATSARFPKVFGDLRIVPRERFGSLRLGIRRDAFDALVGTGTCGPRCSVYFSSIARQWYPRNLGMLDSWYNVGVVAGFCSSNDRLYGAFAGNPLGTGVPNEEALHFAVTHMTTPEGLMPAVHRLPHFVRTYGNPVKIITPAIWANPWILFSDGLVVVKNSADDGVHRIGTYDERVCG